MIAFLDASAIIYLLEAQEPWATQVRTELRQLAAAAEASGQPLALALSRLSWLECRVQPLRVRDRARLDRFDAFFSRPDLCWVELSASVVERATALRAVHNLRTPDALQAACCLQLGADAVMISGDSSFARVPGLALLRLESEIP